MKVNLKSLDSKRFATGWLTGRIEDDVQTVFGMLIMMGHHPDSIRREFYSVGQSFYDESNTD